MLNLAVCYERAGKLASAWSGYTDAATAARHVSEDARATFADEHAKALAPRLAHITIRVPTGTTLTIKLDGAAIGPAAWGTPLPADVGTHHIVSLRDGRSVWQGDVVVRADGDSVALDVPAAATTAEGPPVATTEGTAAETPSRVPAYVAFGIGGAGLVVGTIFGVITLGKVSTLKNECPTSDGCPASAQNDIGSLHTNQWIADIGFGVGLVGAGVGTWLLLTTPAAGTREASDVSVRVVPLVGVGSVGLRGSFR